MDAIRKTRLEDMGYTVIEIWESDNYNDKRQKIISTCLGEGK